MRTQHTTVPLASGRVRNHTATFARRIVNTMTSEKTPPETRRELRETLKNLFACTDIDRRRSVFKVENVALVLGCTGLYRLDRKYAEAREARTNLCRVLEDYDRATRPWLYPWLREKRHPARRAQRLVGMVPPDDAPALRAAA